MPAVLLTTEKYSSCQHLPCDMERSAGPSFTIKVSLFWEPVWYFVGDASVLSRCILGMVSLSILRLPLGKGCVVFLFEEHFHYRNDTCEHGDIEAQRGEGRGCSWGFLIWCSSPRPEKIKALPNVWQLWKLTASSLKEAPTYGLVLPHPLLFLLMTWVFLQQLSFGSCWSHRCMG